MREEELKGFGGCNNYNWKDGWRQGGTEKRRERRVEGWTDGNRQVEKDFGPDQRKAILIGNGKTRPDTYD